MMYKLFKNKIISSLCLNTLIVCLVFIPLSQTLELKKAEALDAVVVIGGNGTIQETISAAADVASAASAAISAAMDTSFFTKEYILDTIVWPLTNIVIKEMIRSTTQWVNSGFKGSPAFVTDLQGFLLDIADKVAGNYIFGSALSALCSPFSLNIKLALDIQYRGGGASGYVAQCRLTNVIKNVDQFFKGDFLQGGWDGWYNVALVPVNNPYGAMLEAQGGLYARISGAQGAEIKLLEFGRGLLSVKDANGKVTTPGAVVETQLNNVLDLPAKRIAVADEINELIGALFAQVAKEALSGVGGMLGLTRSAPGGGGNYFNQMEVERTPVSYSITNGGPIELAVADETRYLNFQRTIIDIISDASLYKNRIYGSSTCSDGSLTTSLSNQLTSARSAESTTLNTLTTLKTLQSEYSLLQNVETPASILATLLEKYNARSVPDAQSKVMEQYMQFQASGSLHNQNDLVTLDLRTIPALREEIPPFTASIDRACFDAGNNNNASQD